VFYRQWWHWKTEEEKKCRDQLAAMISHRETGELKFDEVLVKCQQLVQNIMVELSKPFLLQTAERVYEKLKEDHAASSLQPVMGNWMFLV